MRYLTVANLKEGMVLERAVYGGNFEVLIGQGTKMNATQIKRINDLGYAGAYVFDDLTQEAETRDIIPDELRIRAIKAAKDMLHQAELAAKNQPTNKKANERSLKVVQPIIDSIISSRHRIIDLVDLKPFDSYNYYHAASVTVLSILIGVELGISGVQLYDLGAAALLHDVGDIFTPKEILQKPGKLTDDERELIKQHTERGFEFLKDEFAFSIDSCVGVFQHHENYNGTGYPQQISKNKISLFGRIIAVAEVYDALVSRRPFREAMYPPEAMEFITYHSGSMFDPEIVDILKRVIALYPVGFCVELTSKVRCFVIGNYVSSPERPYLRLLNAMSSTPLYIDLLNDPKFANVRVTQILDQ